MYSRADCSVPGCSTVLRRELITLHRFPKKSPTQRSTWMQFCRIKEDHSLVERFICSRHFPEDAYQPSFKLLGRDRKAWRLLFNAVPSLYPPTSPDDDHVPSGTSKCDDIIPIDNSTEFQGSTEETNTPPTSKCRLCLSTVDIDNGTAVNLFQSQGNNISLSEQILSWFRLELEDSPAWPSYICVACSGTMSQISQFKKTIVSSHCSLHQMIVPEENEEIDQEDQHSVDTDEETSAAPANKRRSSETLLRVPRSAEKTFELEALLVSLQVLKCSVCQSDFRCFPSLEAHMKLEHSNAMEYIECCGETVTGLTNIMDHMEYHQNPEKFKCSDCELRCTTYDNLFQHRYNSHRKKRFQCEVCGKTSNKIDHYESHVGTHFPKDQRPAKCPHCPKAFSQKNGLQLHIQRMHDIKKRHVCEVCGRGFSNYSTYWSHKQTTHDGVVYKRMGPNIKPPSRSKREKRPCTVCGSMTTNLMWHMKDKHGDMEYVPDNYDREPIPCEECGVLVPRYRMYRHIWNTHKRKPFSCEVCKMEFKWHASYEKHMDNHLDRKYPCPHCDTVKDTSNARYLHIRSYHPEEFAKKKKPDQNDGE